MPDSSAAATVRSKHEHAKWGAVLVVAGGLVLTIIGHGSLFFAPPASMTMLIFVGLLSLLGPLIVFLGFMGLYTYYEQIEAWKYYRDEEMGVGGTMEKNAQPRL